MAIRTVTCVLLAVVGVSVFAPWQGNSLASLDIVHT